MHSSVEPQRVLKATTTGANRTDQWLVQLLRSFFGGLSRRQDGSWARKAQRSGLLPQDSDVSAVVSKAGVANPGVST